MGLMWYLGVDVIAQRAAPATPPLEWLRHGNFRSPRGLTVASASQVF